MKAAKVLSKTVLVTGCSSGIGKEVAIYLRRTGWDVYPTARSEADLKELCSNGFEALYLDLSDSNSINSCVQSLLQKCKLGVGALINNAGMAIPGAVEDLSRKDLREQFEVNVFGLQELTNAIIPSFRNQGWGRIVNISSIYGVVAAPMVGGYCASKYALEALSNAQRMELSGSGVSLSLVEPGPILSNFRQSAYERLEERLLKTDHFYTNYNQTLKRKKDKHQKKTKFTRGPENVAKKVHHAITSNNPRIRYFVTIPAHAGSVMARLFPDSLIDFAMKRSI